jgi:hypothetical protein
MNESCFVVPVPDPSQVTAGWRIPGFRFGRPAQAAAAARVVELSAWLPNV